MTRIRATLFAAAALLATGFGAAHAFASDYRDFSIENDHRGAAIVGVWYAHAGTNEPWQPVTLSAPIAPGESSDFTVSLPPGDDMFDFKVRFTNGEVETAGNVDLSTTATVVAD